MTSQTIQNASRSASARAETIRDVLLVSSFGLWTTVLGLAPVLGYRLLMGS
jgi:hypothetical protein